MEAVLQHIADTLRGMWHRRWIGLAVAWVAAIVAVTIAWRIPERYEASARVYVDTQSLLRPLMEGLSIQPNLNQQVALMSRTLISRPNVEKVVRMADLDLDASSPDAREERIDGLMKSVQLSGNVNTNLYVISYRHSNPELARKVVQSFLTIFVESSLGDKRQDAKTAVKFVDDQGLRHVIHAPGGQPLEDIFRFGEAGHEDHGEAAEQLVALHAPAGLEAVESGHDGIHEHEVGRDLFDETQCAGAVGGDQHREARVIERIGEKAERFGSVVDDEDGVAAHVGCVEGGCVSHVCAFLPARSCTG